MNENSVCNPDECPECMYIGDGDSMCMNETYGDPEIVLENWVPTDKYLRCQE